MFSITTLCSKVYWSLRSFFADLMEEEINDCNFCAHHDLALRRTDKYECPRCGTVYTRKP